MSDSSQDSGATFAWDVPARRWDFRSSAGLLFCWIGILFILNHLKSPELVTVFTRRNIFGAIPDPSMPLGMALLLCGIAYIAASSPWRMVPWAAIDLMVMQRRSRVPGEWGDLPDRRGILAVAAVLYSGVIACLYGASYHHAIVVPFLGAIACFGVAFRSGRPSCAEDFSIRWSDIAVLLAIPLLVLGRYWGDLSSWYFSFWGDERVFYEMGRALLHQPQLSVFHYEGVYQKFPVFDSYVVSFFLAIFGESVVGWKIGSVLILGFLCGALYLCGAVLFGRMVGTISSLLLVASHYAGAFALIGYNNLHMCLTSTVVVTLYAASYRNRSRVLAYAAGVVSGLMTYSIWGGLIIVPIIGFLALGLSGVRGGKEEIVRLITPLGFGFLLAALPGLVFNSVDSFVNVVTGLSHGKGFVGSLTLDGAPWSSWTSLLTSIAVFFRNDWWGSHYVFSALLDPVTGFFVVLGIGVIAGAGRSWGAAIVFAWVSMGFVAILGLSRLNSPYLTRLLFLVPPLMLVGGVGAVWLLQKIRRDGERVVVLALAVGLIFILNLQQLYIQSPLSGSMNPPRALIREVQHERNDYILVVSGSRRFDPALCNLIRDYAPSSRSITCLTKSELLDIMMTMRVRGESLHRTTVLAPLALRELLGEVSKRFFNGRPVLTTGTDFGGEPLLTLNGRMSREALAEIRPFPDWVRRLLGIG